MTGGILSQLKARVEVVRGAATPSFSTAKSESQKTLEEDRLGLLPGGAKVARVKSPKRIGDLSLKKG